MTETILPIHPRTGLQAVGWRKARPGEDGDQPIWPIAGASDDGDTDDTGDSQDDADDVDNADTDDASGDDTDDDAGADQLGDAGKKALDAMKAKRNSYRDQLRAAQAELEKLRNGAKKDGEPSAEDIRRDAEQAATAKANARIIRSEIRAAAAGKLADPKDALTFLDLSQFEVDENGEVDSDEVAEAIEELLKNKPYLAAATAKRFQGTGDGGAARKAGNKPKQVTEAELKTMTPEQIVKAQNEGRLVDLLGAG
jgi:hypothetical protein